MAVESRVIHFQLYFCTKIQLQSVDLIKLIHFFWQLCCIQVLSYMEDNGIEVREYGAVSSDVALLASNQLNALSAVKGTQAEVTGNGTKEMKDEFELIWADPTSCCYALYSKLDADKVLLRPSPLALAKAIKVVYAILIQWRWYMVCSSGNGWGFPMT